MIRRMSSGFYVVEVESGATVTIVPTRRPHHLEQRLSGKRRRSLLSLNHAAHLKAAESNRAALMNARRVRLERHSSRVQAVAQKQAAQRANGKRLVQERLERELEAAERKRRALLEQQVAQYAAAVQHAKQVAQTHEANRMAKQTEQRQSLERKLTDGAIRRQRLLSIPRGAQLLHDNDDQVRQANDKNATELACVPDEAATTIQTWWRQTYMHASVKAFRHLGLNRQSAMEMSFSRLGALLKRPATVKITSVMLQRLRRSSSHWKVSNPARVFLTAYMVVAHPDAILGNVIDSEEAKELKSLAEKATLALEEWLAHCHTIQCHEMLRAFLPLWREYHEKFDAWQTRDRLQIVESLMLHLIDLERLWFNVRSQADAEETWKPKILSQQASLKTQLSKMGGEEAMATLESRLAAFRLELDIAPIESTTSPASNSSTSPSRRATVSPPPTAALPSPVIKPEMVPAVMAESAASSSRLDLSRVFGADSASSGLSNELLAHELILDPDFKLKSNLETAEDLNSKVDMRDQAAMQRRVAALSRRAYFDRIREEVQVNRFESWLPELLSNVREQLLAMVPEKSTVAGHIRETLDMELLQQQIKHNAFDWHRVFGFIMHTMRQLCAPVRDAAIRELSSAETFAQIDLDGLMRMLEFMRLDLANYRLQTLKPTLQEHLVEYEANNLDKVLKNVPEQEQLPRTRAWLTAAAQEAAATAAARNPEQIDIPENKPKFEEVYYDALLSLLCAPTAHSPETLPETLRLDAQRIHSFQNEVQKLTVIASLIMLTRQAVPALGNDVHAMSLSLRQALHVLLDDPTTQLSHIQTQVVSLVQNTLAARAAARKGIPSSLTPQQVENLEQMVEKTLSTRDTVFSLLMRRVTAAIRLHLTSGRFRKETLPRHGLEVVSDELAKLSERVFLLAQHNRRVHAKWYDAILSEVLKA